MPGDGLSTEASGSQTGETLETGFQEAKSQVEVLLKEAGQNRLSQDKTTSESVGPQSTEVPVIDDTIFQGVDFTAPNLSFDDGAAFSFQQDPATAFSTGNLAAQGQDNPPFNGELIDLGGIFESLPPFEMMEELNRVFFERHQHLIPIIHPSRYLQAFYSAPHMKPPMCLQYAIWALAATGHPKYGAYSEVFYRRARQYADSDEMKGYGEHFITVYHAQALCIIATYEAKSTMFTRAAMSVSRAVRLVEMMGLHRLDGAAEEISPTLLPPKDWTELEERRRVFWGVFCIDSHCSISTGWPFLVDASEVTTLLPAPESAFNDGEKVETCSLHDAFQGQPYSSFAGAVLVCHLFNQILKHVHKPKPSDNPDNYEHGEYWQRHRDIDNTLSSAFMYLPQSFRMPENYRDPVAVHTNLNLHASTICLHHSAIETIDTYKLPESAKKVSQDRLRTAAQEIVNIIKLTSHVNVSPRSSLAALSLYCAASVYIYLCKEAQAPTNAENLDFLITAMEALGRGHPITRAFLRQVVADIERNGIQNIVRLPHLDNLGADFRTQVSHNIPLLARSKISRHSEVQPPLPGRLPLGNPVGKIIDLDYSQCAHGTWTSRYQENESSLRETRSAENVGNNKRKRTSLSHGTSTADGTSECNDSPWAASGMQDRISTNPSTHSSPPDHLTTGTPRQPMPCSAGYGADFQQVNLPHRTGSPHVNTYPGAATSSQPPVSGPAAQNSSRTGLNIVPSVVMGCMGPKPFRGSDQSRAKDQVRDWDLAGAYMGVQFGHAEHAANNREAGFQAPGNETGRGNENIPWGLGGGEGMHLDWEALGVNLDFNPEGVGDPSGAGLGAEARGGEHGGT
ncbi:fungal-specific transcription factor domain-containing protein [Hypoxylon sp. FL1857]|nr:fungal-specific transcription factor domain-containing protein [Hypoxylon sp. FL1857]